MGKRKRARAREREKTTTTSVSSVASKVTHIEMWVFGLSAGTTKSCASSRLLTVSTSSSRSHDLTNGVTKTFVFRNKSVNTTTTSTTSSSGRRRTKTISRRVLGSTFERPSCVARAQTEEHAGQDMDFETQDQLAPCITLTDNALAHLTQLKEQKVVSSNAEKNALLLRIGVKQGGCSGMSYFMDFETQDQVVEDDAVMELEGDMKLVCDPKSLLYLFGMVLDYSNELIGGGFKFSNPNADSTCGCGKSFSV